VGAQPEHRESLTDEQPITWIGRDRAAIGSVLPSSGDIVPSTEAIPLPLAHPREEAPAGPWPALGGTRLRWVAIGVGLVLVALVLAVVLRYGKGTTAATAGSEGAVPLVSAKVPGLTPVTSTVTFTGAINARYDMPIGTEGETGRIAALYVEAGDHVRKGQVLARLDDSILRPQVSRLEASVDEARANAALAEAQYGRARGVESAGALSAEEIEKRRAAAVTAGAQVKVAEAQLAEYQARLAHTEIRAPEDGLVLTRTAEVGQIATPGGNALFRLARGGEVEMRGQVAEQDLPSLKIGQAALVRLTGSERAFSGKVRLLGAVIDPQTRLGEIRVALDPDPVLRPGAFARGEVVVGHAPRPVLPQTAVLSDEKGTYVLVVDGSGRVERRGVRVADTTADGIVIASGLNGTEQVVTTAAGFLRAGERVSVAPSRGR
jgi:RND family efflux transporter MFP subunit